MRRQQLPVLVAAAIIATSAVAAGNAGGEIKKAMKAKSGATWYLKTNVPYLQGRHVYGTFKRPIVSVTPKAGVKVQDTAEVQGGAFHAEGRNLTLRVNDPVRIDEFEWDSDESSLEIEMEGTARAEGGQGVLKLAELTSLKDFEECWEKTFSSVSLETKYDWPENIRTAVLERQVLDGMTMEQVVVAIGYPDRVRKSTDGGNEVETWTVQMGEGSRMGFWTAKIGDRREIEVRFVNGKVTGMAGTDAKTSVTIK